MLALLYLGTSGCDVLVDEVLSGHVDAVLVLVAADPRTLGAAGEGEAAGDARALADLVLDRGLRRARQAMAREAGSLGGVFDQAPSPGDLPIQGQVCPGNLEEALPDALAAAGSSHLYASRDALEVLGQFGIDVAAALDDAGLELGAR